MGDQAQSTNFKEAFSLFDKRGNGRVQLDSLGDLLRACGQNPTQQEIRDLESQVGGDCESFYDIYPSRTRGENALGAEMLIFWGS